ncbi:MAG: uncharacterized membrane protein YjfL (UPF0719 family), partial [Myxococcota bacterium]
SDGTIALDIDDVVRTAAFFGASVVLVAVSKLVRDKLAHRKGFALPQRVVEDNNVAVGVEMGGFVLAVILGLLGGLVVQGTEWWEQGRDLLLTWGIVTGVLLANDQLVSRWVLRGLDCNGAVAHDGNLAVAIVRASANIGTALVLQGSLGNDSPMLERIIWVLIGQVALVGLSLAYQVLTRYDDVAEVRHRNVAAALPMAGVLIAVGIVVQSVLQGTSAGWTDDLLSLVLDLAVSALLVVVLRWGGERLFLPGASYHEEIVRDKNTGVGFIEAVTYVAAALMVAYFLN